jgi:Na+-transporting methylmalonyl-CoA/oxaloacetate decarboxylase gamma subunit
MSADSHDAYHTHTRDEGAPQHEHGATASPKALGITLIVMVLGVLVVILGLVVYFDNYMSNYEASVNETDEISGATWNEIQEHKAALEQYAWLDANTVRIPLSEAKAQVIAQYQALAESSTETVASN